MAGTDTVRGISFQHAFAVLVSVDALCDPEVAFLRYEGSEDCIDLEALRNDGELAWGLQAKTRVEGAQWNLADLKPILKSWFSTPRPDGCRFRFVTDGQLGKGGLKLRQAINVVARGGHSGAVDEVAAALELTPDNLGLITLSTRVGDTRTLLDLAQLMLLRASASSDPLTPEQAGESILRLYAEISLISGEAEPDARVLEKSRLREILATTPAEDPVARSSLDVLPDGHELTFLTADHVARADLIAEASARLHASPSGAARVALWGPPGFGKSTLAEAVGGLERAAGRTVLWLHAGQETDTRTLLAKLAQIDSVAPVAVEHLLITDLAAAASAQMAAADLLVVDDLRDADAARTLATIVPDAVSLLVTAGDRDVADAYDIVEVGTLDIAAVRENLHSQLPDCLEVADLAEAIGGWPLLLDLVRRSIRRQLRAGRAAGDVARFHLDLLSTAGPTAFDSGGATRSRAVEASLRACLDGLTDDEARSAMSLGAIASGEPVELDLLGVLWRLDEAATRSVAIPLDDVGVLRVDFSRQVAVVHPVVAAGLSSIASAELDLAAHQAIASTYGSTISRSSRYLATYLPYHLLMACRDEEGLGLLLDAAWSRTVAGLLGDDRFLAIQALELATAVSLRGDADSTDSLLVAWLIARAHATRAQLDPLLVPLFALVKGPRLAEALVQASASVTNPALGHAHLAALFLEQGDPASADRNARAARDAAAKSLELGIPDTLITTVKRLSKASPGWALACREALDDCISQQPPEYRDLARAVIACELLCTNPDLSISVAKELLDRLRQAVDDSTPLDAVMGDYSHQVLVNLTSVATAADRDLGFLLADETAAHDTAFPWTIALGGPAAGLLVSDPASVLADESLLAQCRGLVEPIEHAISTLVSRDQVEWSSRLCDLHPSGVIAVRLRSHLVTEMVRAGSPEPDVLGQIDRAKNAVAELANPVALLEGGCYFAEALLGFDSRWSASICRQLLELPVSADGSSVEDAVRTRLATVLARSQPGSAGVIGPAGLANTRANTSPSGSVVLQPYEAFEELTDQLCAHLLRATGEPPLDTLRALRRWSRRGSSFWNAAYDRVHDGNDELVDFLISDPGFGNNWSYAGGRVSELLVKVADRASVSEACDLADRIDGTGRSGSLVGLAVLVACRGGPDADVETIAGRLDSVFQRELLRAQVNAASAFVAGDASTGLLELVSAERRRVEEQDPRGSYRLRVRPIPPIPRAFTELLKSVDMATLAAIPPGQWADPAGRAVLRAVLPRLSATDPAACLELAASSAPSAADAESMQLGILADLAERDPTTAAPYLEGFPTPIDEDAFSRGCCAVLAEGGPAATSIAAFTETWLKETEEPDRETAWTVRLAARLLARESEPPTRASARGLVNPIVVGPTLTNAASFGDDWARAERVNVLLDGIQASAAVGPSDFVFTSRLTGEALATLGYSWIPEVARHRGFEIWPGGFAGLCISLAQVIRADGAGLTTDRALRLLTGLQAWTAGR